MSSERNWSTNSSTGGSAGTSSSEGNLFSQYFLICNDSRSASKKWPGGNSKITRNAVSGLGGAQNRNTCWIIAGRSSAGTRRSAKMALISEAKNKVLSTWV